MRSLVSSTLVKQLQSLRTARCFTTQQRLHSQHRPGQSLTKLHSSALLTNNYTQHPFIQSRRVHHDPFASQQELPDKKTLDACYKFFESATHRYLTSTTTPALLSNLDASTPISSASALIPEVVFLGRSNCGKSSLLNALLSIGPAAIVKKDGSGRSQAKQAAQRAQDLSFTSKKAGSTKTLSIFEVEGRLPTALRSSVAVEVETEPGDDNADSSAFHRSRKPKGKGPLVKFRIVDTPGYGTSSRQEWGEMVLSYLKSRRQLKSAFILLAANTISLPEVVPVPASPVSRYRQRRGEFLKETPSIPEPQSETEIISQADKMMLNILDTSSTPYSLVLTKIDSLISSPSPFPPLLSGQNSPIQTVMSAIKSDLSTRSSSKGSNSTPTILGTSVLPPSKKGRKAEKLQNMTKEESGLSMLMWSVLRACGYL